MKTTQIWQITLNCGDKKFLEATSLDDALQRARDWSQEEFNKAKKEEGKNFDEQEFANSFNVEGVELYLETDI